LKKKGVTQIEIRRLNKS